MTMSKGSKKRVAPKQEPSGFGIFTLDKKNKKLLPKRARSCLQCQQRKVKCQIAETGAGQGCEVCVTKGKECSLIQESAVVATAEPPSEREMEPKKTVMDQFNNFDWLKFMDEEISNSDFSFDFLSINHSPGLSLTNDLIEEFQPVLPIELRNKDASYTYYGASGEYDPWLRYSYYQYDQNNECFFSAKFFRKMGTQLEPVIFAFKDKDRLLKESKEVGRGKQKVVDNGEVFERLSGFIPNFTVLYLKFIFPSLPIFDGDFLHEVFSNETQEYQSNKDHIDVLLLLMLAKSVRRWDTYDTSIDMFTDDDELLLNNRRDLLTEAWSLLMDQFHTPTLSTLKSLILFYHILGFKKDSQSNGFERTVLSSMVTTSYALGLHLDCSNWNIPEHEKKLRTRIWWTVYLLEKWGSFVNGQPSLINDREFSVPRDFDGMFEDVTEYLNNDEGIMQCFEMLLKLTFALNDIWTELFSLSSLSRPKEEVLAICNAMEQRLNAWKREFTQIRTNSNSSTYSIMLSYHVLQIVLFRARLRVLSVSEYQDMFFDNAKSQLGEIIQFLTTLPVSSIHGFWYRWSRSLFMYLKDFVLSLIVMSKTKQQSLDVLNLARKFREWLELNSKSLEILWTTLLRLNIATQSIGTQFRDITKRT